MPAYGTSSSHWQILANVVLPPVLWQSGHICTYCFSQICNWIYCLPWHYSDVIMTSRTTGVSIVFSTACSGAYQREHQSCVSLHFVTGEFPAQRPSDAENVSIWWRHHGVSMQVRPCLVVLTFHQGWCEDTTLCVKRCALIIIRLSSDQSCTSFLPYPCKHLITYNDEALICNTSFLNINLSRHPNMKK